MIETRAKRGYSSLQIGLHWTVAALVLLQFLASGPIEDSWHAYVRQEAAPSDTGPTYLHIVTGLLIFGLALWRIWLRVTRGVPALPANEPKALRAVAHTTHFLIYALIIGMPISGSVAWFLGVEPAAAAHVLARNALLALIVLHVAGALFQQIVLRSNVLSRMLMTLD